MKEKISKTKFIIMLIVAGTADIISFFISLVPVFGQAVNPVWSFLIIGIFWFWFAFSGLGFLGSLGSGASAVVEFIPALQLVPSFILMVIVIYLKTKVKDIPVVGKVVRKIGPKRLGGAL